MKRLERNRAWWVRAEAGVAAQCTDEPASGRARPIWGQGMTLVEVVVSTAVVGLMLVAALNTVGATARSYAAARNLQQGHLLAQQLMAEILEGRYEDPGGSPVFGREAGETTTGRSGYDDVDDYDGWSACPSQQRDGTLVPGAEDWTREVAVEWVDPSDPSVAVASESGLKRITVTATNSRGRQFTCVALRASSGTMELRPPVDQIYIVGLQTELQVGKAATPAGGGAPVSNHARDQ